MSYQSKYSGREIDSKLDQVDNKVNQSDLNDINEQLETKSNLTYVNEQVNNINSILNNKLNTSDLLDKVYPVGSIYLAYNHTSPASLFGGTWTRISQRMLWGSSSDGTIGATGGVGTHTHTSAAHTHTIAGHTHTTTAVALTVAQLPAHRHTGLDIDGVYVFGWDDGDYSGYNFISSTPNDSTVGNRIRTGSTGSGSTHSHGNTGSTSLTTNSTTPGATGSSSNMPPYIQVSIWRRTE